MSTPIIAVFGNMGGVGKTSIVFHLAWMFSDRGMRVVAADLDPRANLTAAFLDEDRLEEVLSIDGHGLTVFGAIQPLIRGVGDVSRAHVEPISETLGLVVGDIALSTFEDQLSEAWIKCIDGDELAFRMISAFWRILQQAAEDHDADVILIDLGPNLGAINRAALIASDFVAIPLGPDLFSLQGLENLGPVMRLWRQQWRERLDRSPDKALSLPPGNIKPLGYLVLYRAIRLDRRARAFERWMARIPATYAEAVLQRKTPDSVSVDEDPHCIAKLQDYRSLMPLAQETRKPVFFLKPADGALGVFISAVKGAYDDFYAVAREIAKRAGLKAV